MLNPQPRLTFQTYAQNKGVKNIFTEYSKNTNRPITYEEVLAFQQIIL